MTATTVTPDIVLTVFLRRIGISFVFSSGFRCCMICEFGGIFCSLCFLAICILTRFRSFFVGLGICIRRVMISRFAFCVFIGCSILLLFGCTFFQINAVFLFASVFSLLFFVVSYLEGDEK